jgi:hypothetical protein
MLMSEILFVNRLGVNPQSQTYICMVSGHFVSLANTLAMLDESSKIDTVMVSLFEFMQMREAYRCVHLICYTKIPALYSSLLHPKNRKNEIQRVCYELMQCILNFSHTFNIRFYKY